MTIGKIAQTLVKKIWLLLEFLAFFGWELIVSNLRLAHDIVTPWNKMRSGIIAVPLDAKGEREIALLANLISLTPGTLTIDVSPDNRHLYIHAMYLEDIDVFRKKIKIEFERRVIDLLK